MVIIEKMDPFWGSCICKSELVFFRKLYVLWINYLIVEAEVLSPNLTFISVRETSMSLCCFPNFDSALY